MTKIQIISRCLIFSIILLAHQIQAQIEQVVEVKKIARLTGAQGSDSINPTWKVNIGGVDLGWMLNHKDKPYFVFGDSFSSELTGEGWRWNTMAYTTDKDPTDGITFDGWITDEQGYAKQIIRDERNKPITNIPTGGISINDTIYIFYMAVNFWGDSRQPCWRASHSGLAYSKDDGNTFVIVPDFIFSSNSNFGMVSLAPGNQNPQLKDDYIYMWGTPANRCGCVKLARFLAEDITNKSKYQFFTKLQDGVPQWTENELSAGTVVNAPVGEMSVMFNKWARVWMMLHFKYEDDVIKHNAPANIVLRQSPTPWGPWSEPILIASHKQYPSLYGSYLNPKYVENDGESVYFTMSLWDPYDVFWMKARFKKKE